MEIPTLKCVDCPSKEREDAVVIFDGKSLCEYHYKLMNR
jgi:hypothetical protein